MRRIFSCVGPKGRLWSEEVSAKSGLAGAALAITHLMLGRKLYSQSQQVEQAAVWQKGGRVFILSSLVQSAFCAQEVVWVLCLSLHCYKKFLNDFQPVLSSSCRIPSSFLIYQLKKEHKDH